MNPSFSFVPEEIAKQAISIARDIANAATLAADAAWLAAFTYAKTNGIAPEDAE